VAALARDYEAALARDYDTQQHHFIINLHLSYISSLHFYSSSSNGAVDGECRYPKYFLGGMLFPQIISGQGGTVIQ